MVGIAKSCLVHTLGAVFTIKTLSEEGCKGPGQINNDAAFVMRQSFPFLMQIATSTYVTESGIDKGRKY